MFIPITSYFEVISLVSAKMKEKIFVYCHLLLLLLLQFVLLFKLTKKKRKIDTKVNIRGRKFFSIFLQLYKSKLVDINGMKSKKKKLLFLC